MRSQSFIKDANLVYYLKVTIVAHRLISVVYLTACALYQVMITLHFLNDVADDAESTQKSNISS